MKAVLGVDFAPRFSAAALMTPEGALVEHFTLDVGPQSDGFDAHVLRLAAFQENVLAYLAHEHLLPSDVLPVVEDVTHFMTKPAQVLRLQGAFRTMLWLNEFPTPTMVYPAEWQNFFGWHKTPGTTSKGFAKFACSALDYVIAGTKGKGTVDVRDAVLIARWYVEQQKKVKSLVGEISSTEASG